MLNNIYFLERIPPDMKPFIYVLGLVVLSHTANSQEYNVPFKHQDRYVLINKNGTKVLDKSYDHLKWLEGAYFIGSVYTKSTEPLDLGPDKHGYGRYAEGIIETDLIYNNKVLIAKSPFKYFSTKGDHIIVGRCRNFGSVKDKASLDKYGIEEDEQSVLFNKNGKPILPKAVFSIDFVQPIVYNNDTTHYAFIAKESRSLSNVYLYDVKKQAVVQTFLKQTKRTGLANFDMKEGLYMYAYETAPEEYETKTFKFNGKIMVPSEATIKSSSDMYESASNYYGGGSYNAFDNDVKVAPPNEGPIYMNTTNNQAQETNYYYRIVNDTVYKFPEYFNYKTAEVMDVNTKAAAYKKPLGLHAAGIIKSEKGQYEVITPNKRSGIIYTDAYYIGSNYYLVKDQQHKYGILNRHLQVVVPMVYDSIYVLPLNIQPSPYGTKISSSFKPLYADSHYKELSDYVYAYKNNKVDIYNRDFLPLMVDSFDGAYRNTTHASDYYPATYQPYITSSGNDYYAVVDSRANTKMDLIGPFVGYPLYFYKNYYGINGLKLYIVYNKNFEFLGYADQSGKLLKMK